MAVAAAMTAMAAIVEDVGLLDIDILVDDDVLRRVDILDDVDVFGIVDRLVDRDRLVDGDVLRRINIVGDGDGLVDVDVLGVINVVGDIDLLVVIVGGVVVHRRLVDVNRIVVVVVLDGLVDVDLVAAAIIVVAAIVVGLDVQLAAAAEIMIAAAIALAARGVAGLDGRVGRADLRGALGRSEVSDRGIEIPHLGHPPGLRRKRTGQQTGADERRSEEHSGFERHVTAPVALRGVNFRNPCFMIRATGRILPAKPLVSFWHSDFALEAVPYEVSPSPVRLLPPLPLIATPLPGLLMARA